MAGGPSEVWAGLPENVDHPYQVAIIEALRHIGEPLSAIGVVDVLDGHMSMWSAAAHLITLERLGVVEPVHDETGASSRDERFVALYRLGMGSDGQRD